nr:MAG TPA: hypothetical protein [Bacteriophage sp.]
MQNLRQSQKIKKAGAPNHKRTGTNQKRKVALL